MLLLPETGAGDAAIVAEKLRAKENGRDRVEVSGGRRLEAVAAGETAA